MNFYSKNKKNQNLKQFNIQKKKKNKKKNEIKHRNIPPFKTLNNK